MESIQSNFSALVLGIIIGGIVGWLFAKIALSGLIRDARKHATKRSRAVILGEVNEKMAPLLPGFPYDYKDLVFIGKGVDYLVFDGLSRGELRQVVLLEIKSGRSNLNRNEIMIREAVSNGNVCYEVFRIS